MSLLPTTRYLPELRPVQPLQEAGSVMAGVSVGVKTDEFEITDLRTKMQCRSVFVGEMELLIHGIVKFPDGSFFGVSRWHDDWVVDSYFTGNMMPRWSNGTGSRCTAGRTIAPDSSVFVELEKLRTLLEAEVSA